MTSYRENVIGGSKRINDSLQGTSVLIWDAEDTRGEFFFLLWSYETISIA